MSREMFEYTKSVLKKVSFNPQLFCLELQKAMLRLMPYEKEELRIYVQSLIFQNPELEQCRVYLK